MLNLVLALAVLLLLIIGVEKFYSLYHAYRREKDGVLDAKLKVLKVVAKHECFRDGDPAAFDDWLSRILQVLNYREIRVAPARDGGGGDAVCLDPDGSRVYVECKLWMPERFSEEVGRPALQRLAGAMLADGVKKGLVLTMGSFSEEARRYVKKLPDGYEIRLLDGDELVQKLYQVRKLQLEPLLKPAEEAT
jgi:restriction system protein